MYNVFFFIKSFCRFKISLRDLITSQYTDQVRAFSKQLRIMKNGIMIFEISNKSVVRLFLALQWYNLNDVKSGQVHLVMEWLPRVTDPTRLDQVSPAAVSTVVLTKTPIITG